MTARSHRALPARQWFGGLWVAFACLIAGGGCASTYQAEKLPPEYVARRVDRFTNADPRRLASHSAQNNQIGTGDLIQVAVYSGYDGDKTEPDMVNVAADGRANVPLIGLVPVAGLTPDEAQRAIGQAAYEQDILRTPHVSVRIEERPERKIQVSGLVKLPGEIEMPPNADLRLASAVAMAGGTSEQLADTVLVIRQPPQGRDPITIKASLRDVRRNRGNIVLQENDVVIVEETPVTVGFNLLQKFFRFSIGSSVALF